MISCLRTRVHKQPMIALYFENELKFYNLDARLYTLLLYWSRTFDNGFFFYPYQHIQKAGLGTPVKFIVIFIITLNHTFVQLYC